jgi:hypothetical protein
MIIQVVPEENDSEDYHLEFVSKYVEEEFFKTQWMALKDSIITDLYSKLNDPRVRELYGKPFEKYVQEHAHKLNFQNVTNIDGTATPLESKFCIIFSDETEIFLRRKELFEVHQFENILFILSSCWVGPGVRSM